MAIPYSPPGVTAQEVSSNSIVAGPAASRRLCLVGLSAGSITVTDTVTFADGPGGTVSAPTGVSATASAAGGQLAANTYYYKITAVNANGETTPSTEVSATTTGTSSSINITWTASAGATAYHVYRGTSAGSESVYFTTYGTSYLDMGSVVGTTATPPTSNTATQNGQVPVPLPTLAAQSGATFVAVSGVFDATNPGLTASGPYNYGSDYTIANGAITRTSASNIPATNSVYVTYSYTPADYFTPQVYTDLASIQLRYGPALNSTGTAINYPINGVNSSISFAALCAFANGVSEVYIAPLFTLANPSDPGSVRSQPSATDAVTAGTAWTQTLQGLLSYTDIGTVVPVIGQSATLNNSQLLAIYTAVMSFKNQFAVNQNFFAAHQNYILSVMGEDATASTNGQPNYPDRTTLRQHAATLQSLFGGKMAQQCVLINNGSFGFAFSDRIKPVGGQYFAAALAGLLAASAPSASLTRSTVAGFQSIYDNPPHTRLDKLADAQAGMLVVETQNNGTAITIRHAITLDNTDISRRELSVVNAKFFMMAYCFDLLNAQIIGRVPPSGVSATTWVNTAMTKALEYLKGRGVIANYSGINATPMPNNPTGVSVSFNFLPIYPVNYINIQFALDTNAQTVTASTVS